MSVPIIHPSPAAAADDLKWRSLTCAALSIPVVYLSEPVQVAFGLGVDKRLEMAPGIVLGLAAAVGLYGSWPFVAGLVRETRRALPGPMTLAALAIVAGITAAAEPRISLDERSLRALWLVLLVDALLIGTWMTAIGARHTRRVHDEGRRTGEVITLLAIVAAAAALIAWLELRNVSPSFALGRAAAVLAIASPMAVVASYLRPAPAYLAPAVSGEHASDYVVTHVLVPDGGSEDEVLAAAAGAEGDLALVSASRRAAHQRGAEMPAPTGDSAPARLILTPALREAGLEPPMEALNGLDGTRTVAWVVERWRITGAVALESRGSTTVVRSPHRSSRLRILPSIAYHAAALPIAAGAVPGLYPHAATGALISGVFAASVAWLAGRQREAPVPEGNGR